MLSSSLLCLILVAHPVLRQHAEEEEKQAEKKQPEEEQEEPKQDEQEILGFHEVVVVTAARTEQPLGEAISMVSTFSAEELTQTPAVVLDDQLRRVPGFSLFRRNSSLVAHPATQGVSLRGIGGTAASRSLVLWDGIPLNDPFGHWIYWNRLPRLSLGSVEISRGATSQLYGSSALAGTIQLTSRAPSPDTVELQGQFGSRQTYDVNVLASDTGEDWGYLLSGRLFDTEGFYRVVEPERGPVDEPAAVEFQTFLGRVQYQRFHAGVNLFRERRNNGTRIRRNDSQIYLFETGVDSSSWQLNFYTQHSRLHDSSSRVLPDRSAEFLTAEREYPSVGLGSSFSYRPGKGFLIGVDWRYVRWTEHDQNLAGLFVQNLLPLHPRIDVLLGGRVDLWQNRTTQTSFNPRAGLLFRASNAVTVRASTYRGFRAPSLNELYRPFRVGNILTDPNPELEEEHLLGVEAGVDFHPRRSVLLRFNGFWNSLRDPVANVTLSVTPTVILRQKQNLGAATIKGIEAEASLRLSDNWQAHGAYLYSDARVDDTGLRIPHVAKHQGSVGVRYRGPVQATVEARWVGEEFEDDRNRLTLEGYGLVDLAVRRALTEQVELFFSVENLLDRTYPAGRTPIKTVGPTRLVHGGVYFRLSR